jgi:hypothetical protein
LQIGNPRALTIVSFESLEKKTSVNKDGDFVYRHIAIYIKKNRRLPVLHRPPAVKNYASLLASELFDVKVVSKLTSPKNWTEILQNHYVNGKDAKSCMRVRRFLSSAPIKIGLQISWPPT